MWSFGVKQDYQALALDDQESELEEKNDHDSAGRPATRATFLPICLGILLLLLAATAISIYVFTSRHGELTAPASSGDQTNVSICSLRREWRTLKRNEQQAYISAVKCLHATSSSISKDEKAAAYDDFPWIHSHVGYATHNSAPFLPWHRYFLHVYHKTLREKCSYDGELIYWDWTLDSSSLEQSPIFDPETGFGGDGATDGEITVGRSGRCVVDGPFAHTEVSFYDVKYQPHCLSRGFRALNGTLGHIDGSDISPTSIEEVLSIDNYEGFVASIESKVHDAIPFGIAGDFETFTAPYDPIFFLHHTQLDRLWYMWQQRQPDKGLESYSGHKERHSMEMASLDDELQYRGLAPNVKVRDVMNIENDLLCYRY